MIVNMIELFLVLACLHSSGELTCIECKQLQDEWYTFNCNNTCVEDQNETEEEAGNCTEVNKEIDFHESPIKRLSWRGCEQRQNETRKPANCGRFPGRSKRQDKLLTCEKCRNFEKEGKTMECENICATSCRRCDERSKKTGENCERVCGKPPMSCLECRQKEKERKPVDCEFACALNCYECEEKQELTGEDCEMICGKPRLPCEECRRKEEEDEPVNCEWTCEASCQLCHKMQKRIGKKYQCRKYCGETPSLCLECRRSAITGMPVDCAKKCEKPCLECRKALKKGRIVDCKEVCESSCDACKITQKLTGKPKRCEKFCGEQRIKLERKPVLSCEECRQRELFGEPVFCEEICGRVLGRTAELPVSCTMCRQQEENGEDVDCEWNCDAVCRECEERQKQTYQPLHCEKLCGLPPRPCQTCREREKEGETLDCQWTCASSCTTCEKMERRMNREGRCERFCGQPPLPCRACRWKERKGEAVDCKRICETTCRECKEAEKMSGTSQHCERFCGRKQMAVERTTRGMSCEDCMNSLEWRYPSGCVEACSRPQNMTYLLGYMTCVSCNGLTQRACNIPFQDNKDFTVICEHECEIATFYKTPPQLDEKQQQFVIRGCTGVSESIPSGYTVHQIEPCSFMARCNAYDEFVLASTTPVVLQKRASIRRKKSASASHQMSIHLTWLLFTYHSVF